MTDANPVAVVTGAARGIGKATALALAERGFSIAVMDRLATEAADTIATLSETGTETLSLIGDVADFDAVHGMGQQVIDRWGRIDVLVNNAGVSQPKGILEISEAEWDSTIAINLKGVFNWSRFAAPVMMAQQSGRMVNISSVSANTGAGPTAVSKFAYATAKAGILGLTRSLARELAPHVTVNAICPGAILTDLTRHHFTPRTEAIVKSIPQGRMGAPEDIAEVVAFLATVESKFLTGEIIDVDGGQWIN